MSEEQRDAVITVDATIDGVLAAHRDALGHDFVGYRNHVYRVANLCAALAPEGTGRWETIALAAAFHDLGIWTAGTFDYLGPSIAAMTGWVGTRGSPASVPEVARMIDEHHKIGPSEADRSMLVEPFRQADWIDLLWGVPTFGLPRAVIHRIRRGWPDAGFHVRLGRLALARAGTHPCSPLPMLRR